MSLLELLGFRTEKRGTPEANRLAARIRARCENLPDARVDLVACYAGLLMRVAHADVHLSEEERRALPRLLRERASLSHPEAELVAEITIEARMAGNLDYSQLTRKLNEIATPDEKLALLDCLYAVATADDSVSVAEDEEIRAVANALLLSHGQFISIRSRYKDKLAVLQAPARRVDR